jgi:uncharacterized protein YbaP (TraB family)
MHSSLLWKITPPHSDRHSYLFGTMHVQDIRAFYLIDTLKVLIGECDAFAAEFNLSDADPERMMTAFSLKEGETLMDFLTTKQYERLDKFLRKQFGFSGAQFLQTRPFSIANFLTTAIMHKEMQQSLDETLHSIAEQKGKVMLGLESFDDQLKVLEYIDRKTETKQLMSLVKNYKSHRKSINKLTKLYMEGNIQQLLKSSKKSLGKLRKVLLHDRNLKMANRIEEITQEQTLFSAVGAGHLAGKKGVLELLKDKGFRVKAIVAKFSNEFHLNLPED